MELIELLNISLIIVMVVIVILGGLIFYFIYRGKKKEEKGGGEIGSKNAPPTTNSTFNGMSKESINKFMEFDEIKDDMIVRKNGEQFVMVIQCKGVSYDLMSEEEKLSIEGGFVQFLNTIRFPVQLYIQTRSLNLKNTVDGYKKKVEGLAEEITSLEVKRKEAHMNGNNTLEDKLLFDIRRKQNVLEYGADVTEYIGRMSLNKNVLQQKTYVVISYYASELGSIANYSKDEIRNICFSELYTRCQSVIRSLASAQVFGKVIDSEELAELLYIGYNRDDSELYQLSKALDAEYDALYSTGKDVLKKRQEKIDARIEEDAIELASDAILEAEKRQKEEKRAQEKLRDKALEVVEEYKDSMEEELYEGAKKLIRKANLGDGKEEIKKAIEEPKKRRKKNHYQHDKRCLNKRKVRRKRFYEKRKEYARTSGSGDKRS